MSNDIDLKYDINDLYDRLLNSDDFNKKYEYLLLKEYNLFGKLNSKQIGEIKRRIYLDLYSGKDVSKYLLDNEKYGIFSTDDEIFSVLDNKNLFSTENSYNILKQLLLDIDFTKLNNENKEKYLNYIIINKFSIIKTPLLREGLSKLIETNKEFFKKTHSSNINLLRNVDLYTLFRSFLNDTLPNIKKIKELRNQFLEEYKDHPILKENSEIENRYNSVKTFNHYDDKESDLEGLYNNIQIVKQFCNPTYRIDFKEYSLSTTNDNTYNASLKPNKNNKEISNISRDKFESHIKNYDSQVKSTMKDLADSKKVTYDEDGNIKSIDGEVAVYGGKFKMGENGKLMYISGYGQQIEMSKKLDSNEIENKIGGLIFLDSVGLGYLQESKGIDINIIFNYISETNQSRNIDLKDGLSIKERKLILEELQKLGVIPEGKELVPSKVSKLYDGGDHEFSYMNSKLFDDSGIFRKDQFIVI